MKTFNELLFWLHLDHLSIYVSIRKETKLTRNYEHNLKSRTICICIVNMTNCDASQQGVDKKTCLQIVTAYYAASEIEYLIMTKYISIFHFSNLQ